MPVDEAAKQAQLQALAALAQYGTQGGAAYDTAIANIGQAQQAALSQLSGEAGGMGVVPEGVAELHAIARMPGDQYAASMEQAKAAQAANVAAMSGAQTGYYNQLQQAIPAGQAWWQAQADMQGDILRSEFEMDLARWKMEQDAQDARYGGYGSATEYENAVTAMARDAQQREYEEATGGLTQAGRALGGHLAGILGPARGQGKTLSAPRVKRTDESTLPERMRQAAWGGPFGLIGMGVSSLLGRGDDDVALRRAAPERPPQREARRPIPDMPELGDIGGMAARRQAVQQPTALSDFAREVAINQMGGDPAEALGRFSPEWAEDLWLADMQREVLRNQTMGQLGNIETYGTPTAPSVDPATSAAMRAARVSTPDQLAAIYDSPDYGQANEAVATLIDAGEIATSADLEEALFAMGLPPEFVRLLVYDYQGLLPRG